MEGPSAHIDVTVAAKPEPFEVSLDGVRIVLSPSTAGAPRVSVRGALAFEGTTPTPEMFPWEPVEVADGVVELGATAVLSDATIGDDEVVAKKVDIGTATVIGTIAIPCRSLTFAGSGHPAEAQHRGVNPRPLRDPSCPLPCLSYTTPEELTSRATPDAKDVIVLAGSTIVSEIDRRGPWVRVVTRDFVHLDGGQLTGWVELAKLKKLPGGFGFTGGRSMGEPMRGGRGPVVAKGPGVYQGPARIRAGSAVFDDRVAGAQWATVRDGKAEFEVVVRTGEPRAEILKAPGIPYLSRAWVAGEAVAIASTKP
jgi:hypothetical protein